MDEDAVGGGAVSRRARALHHQDRDAQRDERRLRRVDGEPASQDTDSLIDDIVDDIRSLDYQ